MNAGTAFAGGFGQGLGKSTCWVAAELYGGWFEPRTVLVREWLLGPFSEHLFGRAAMVVYRRFGERIANALKRWPQFKPPFLAVFNLALRKATEVNDAQ
jgi:hypothetical protein